MIKKFFSILLLIVVSLAFYECSDDPTSVGVNQLPTGEPANFKEVNTDSLSQASFFFQDSARLNTASRVIVGKYKQAEASILLKFFAPTLDTAKVSLIKQNNFIIKSATVKMIADYFLNDNGSAVPFTAYKSNIFWTTAFTADSLSKLEPLNEAASVPGTLTRKDSLYSFELNKDLVLQWLQSQVDTSLRFNRGIYLKYDLGAGQDMAVGFPPNSSAISLQVIGGPASDPTDTLDFSISNHLHVVKPVNLSSLPEHSGFLYLQGGISIDAFLKFYFPTLPPNMIVNNATLELTYDTLQTAFGTKTPDQILVNFSLAKDSINVSRSDSVTGSAALSKTGSNQFTGDITHYVNAWFQKNPANYKANLGLKISLLERINTIDFVTFISSENKAQNSLKPRIKIIYSVP